MLDGQFPGLHESHQPRSVLCHPTLVERYRFHAEGTTEISVKPQRIVSLDQTWSDALGKLGVDIAMVMHSEQLE